MGHTDLGFFSQRQILRQRVTCPPFDVVPGRPFHFADPNRRRSSEGGIETHRKRKASPIFRCLSCGPSQRKDTGGEFERDDRGNLANSKLLRPATLAHFKSSPHDSSGLDRLQNPRIISHPQATRRPQLLPLHPRLPHLHSLPLGLTSRVSEPQIAPHSGKLPLPSQALRS